MAEDFIEKFHNLEGTLLKEKKKSLYLLLDCYKLLHTEEHILKEIILKLTPKTYLEEIYKLEFLLYFRRPTDLLEILQSGHDIAASKIIRQSWFINSLFKDMHTEEFVKNVFPQLSVVVRAKILKQILKIQNEHCINALFDSILHEYGLKSAIILLSGCSVDKIREIISTRDLKIIKSQLKLLYNKEPLLINFYFHEFHRKGGIIFELANFAKYFSRKDPLLFVNITLKYQYFSCTLGRKTTKKYVSENKEDILKDPQIYIDRYIFHKQALVKQLGDDFPTFLKALFPQELSGWIMISRILKLLNYYPRSKRYELYLNLFEDVYKKRLFPNKEYITDDLLEVIPDDEIREKWVEKFGNRSEYIKYKRSSVAVVELKKRLVGCEGKKLREELLDYIVTSCSMSRDYVALLDILNLFCHRFRNCEGSVFNRLLDSIYSKIKLDQLTDEHWKYIHEIILIQNTRNLSTHSFIILEYCKFLYKNGRDFEEIMPLFLKGSYSYSRKMKFKDEEFKDDGFQRKFLKLTLKHYTYERRNDDWCTSIILAVRDWNKHHTNEVISVSENKEIIEALKNDIDFYTEFKSDNYLAMNYLVCCENMYDEFTSTYFNYLKTSENITMTRWLLKYKPNFFQENIDKVVKFVTVKRMHSLMKFLRKYEHTGLVQIITKCYLTKLMDPNEEGKDEIAHLLASIMDKNDYIKLLEKNVPQIDKLDLMTASIEEKNLHLIQIALAKSVRFTTCQVEAFPILLKYCRGDYFHPSLSSLYSCFNRVPEISLGHVADFLLEKPVSVGKHAIFLASLVYPVKINEELGQKIISSGKSDSIKNHLFNSTYKYFLKNPLEDFWHLLQSYMDHLSLHETESLTLLTDVHVIPDKYKCKFMKKVCNVFDNLEKKEKIAMTSYYDELMENVEKEDMTLLSSELCVDIISKKLFIENNVNDACLTFTLIFLKCAADMRENIRNVLKVLALYKQEHWNTSFGKVAKSVINYICRHILDYTLYHIYFPKEFPAIFAEEWKHVFSIDETFEEYLMLDFMILKYRDNKDVNFYASEITKIFISLRERYGDLITGLFKNFLSSSLKPLFGKENYNIKLMKLLKKMLEMDPSFPNSLLVLQLLPQYQYDKEFEENYENVLKKLRNADKIKEVYLNMYVKS